MLEFAALVAAAFLGARHQRLMVFFGWYSYLAPIFPDLIDDAAVVGGGGGGCGTFTLTDG